MSSTPGATLDGHSPELARRLRVFITRAAMQSDVRAAVEANHDDNRWWPGYVHDWRMRMAVAGWSSRVSYGMVDTYARVVAGANTLGWERLTALDDEPLRRLVRPIGLVSARVRYLRSLVYFIDRAGVSGADLVSAHPDDLIASITTGVDGAGYNTAQCAVLYARGYHCGVIPVDSGMVTKLAPLLGVNLASGTAGYEQLRQLLQLSVLAQAEAYRELATHLDYRVTIPPGGPPTWFAHLVLIYFKRLYLNWPRHQLCPRRPACPELLDCSCQQIQATS